MCCTKDRQLKLKMSFFLYKEFNDPASCLPTANDVAAVILVTISHIQQQVGAIGVGPVSWLWAGHQLTCHLLIVPVYIQLSHTTNDTERSKIGEPQTVCSFLHFILSFF